MPYSISLTQGYTFSSDGTDKVTYGKLNQLGSPVVSLSGSIDASDLESGSIDTNLIADDAVTGAKIADETVSFNHFVDADQGSIYHMGANGWEVLAPGTSGQFLTSNGAGNDLDWNTPDTVSNISASQITPGSNDQVLQVKSGVPTWSTLASSSAGLVTEAGAPYRASLVGIRGVGLGTGYLNGSSATVTNQVGAGANHFNTNYSHPLNGNTWGVDARENLLGQTNSTYDYIDFTITSAILSTMTNGVLSDITAIKGLGVECEVRAGGDGYAGAFRKSGTRWHPISYAGYDEQRFGSNQAAESIVNSGYHIVPVFGSAPQLRIMATPTTASAPRSIVGLMIVAIYT